MSKEERMSATVIGVDPHKRSHTAVVLDDCEQIASEMRVVASSAQVEQLLAWAPGGDRLWAIENANGLGRLLAQQLVAQAAVARRGDRHRAGVELVGLAPGAARQLARPTRHRRGHIDHRLALRGA